MWLESYSKYVLFSVWPLLLSMMFLSWDMSVWLYVSVLSFYSWIVFHCMDSQLTLSHLTKSLILFASPNILIVFNFSKIQSGIIHCSCVHSLNLLYCRVIPCFMGLTSCRHHASYHRIPHLLGLFECFLVEFLAFSPVLCISYKCD